MGLNAGIKKDKKDMAMIYSVVPCTAAGTFTTNQVKAAPVKWDQKMIYENEFSQAVVCNSGVANACTGEEGMKYCEEMAQETAAMLGINKESVLVASTGVIGAQLPMDKIVNGRAAGVNLNLALLNRFKLFLASCESVENLHLFVLQFLFKLFNFALQSAKLLGDGIGNVNLIKILNSFAVPANDSCRNADSR